MIDMALERSRRCAWAKFYAERAGKQQIAMWAAELAEWLDQADVDLPAEASELIEICRAHVSAGDRWRIARYVRLLTNRMEVAS